MNLKPLFNTKPFPTSSFFSLLMVGWFFLGMANGAGAQTPSDCCQGVTYLGGYKMPAGMAIDYSRNLVYLTDRGSATLYVYTNSGSPVTHFSSWTGGGFTSPQDVALDNQGNIYVADLGAQSVYEFGAGSYSYMEAVASGQVNYPRGDWVDTQGVTVSLYITSQNDNVYRYDSVSGGAFSAGLTFGGSSVLNIPTGIVKQGNNVFVVDDVSDLVEFSGANYSTAVTLYTSTSELKGIRTDLGGNFYVTEESGNLLDKFLSGLGNPPSQCPIPSSPWGVVVDGSGKIFVSEDAGAAMTVLQGCATETPTPSYSGANPPASGDFFIYPSPARGSQATVSYNMAQPGQVDLRVWNEKAELVTQVTDSKSSGVQVTPFSIAGFASGVYYYSLTLTYGSGQVQKLGPQKFAIIH
jgi:hypothetical protein